MAIHCSCNAVITSDFDRALATKSKEVTEQTSLLDAVGLVYREARDTSVFSEGPKQIPSCTNCFNWLARKIKHETGLFEGEELPAKSFAQDCPRRAQCVGPRPADPNVMEDQAAPPCVSFGSVAPL